MNASCPVPVILFGAFDRHNFGDLLFPHIVSSLLPQHKLNFAGLAERDLRGYGGHCVHALGGLLQAWSDDPPVLLHAGGELLTCDSWEAAVMLQTMSEARQMIRHYDGRPREQQAWAAQYLGTMDMVPYMMSAPSLPKGGRIVYNAVGGVDLPSKRLAMRDEILGKLKAAHAVGVRDATTQEHLEQAKLVASLLPDPASLTAELFHDRISLQGEQGEAAASCAAFPQGYIAVQFSAEFIDDASLSAIADQLAKTVQETGFGIVLFRAGAAPWHDDAEAYQRLATRLPKGKVRIFSSLCLWDICALIAYSRAYCGSSLHGRIVAMAYALPRLNLVPDSRSASAPEAMSKQAAYAASWDSRDMPAVASPFQLHDALMRALTVEEGPLRQVAQRCRRAYLSGFAELRRQAGF